MVEKEEEGHGTRTYLPTNLPAGREYRFAAVCVFARLKIRRSSLSFYSAQPISLKFFPVNLLRDFETSFGPKPTTSTQQLNIQMSTILASCQRNDQWGCASIWNHLVWWTPGKSMRKHLSPPASEISLIQRDIKKIPFSHDLLLFYFFSLEIGPIRRDLLTELERRLIVAKRTAKEEINQSKNKSGIIYK